VCGLRTQTRSLISCCRRGDIRISAAPAALPRRPHSSSSRRAAPRPCTCMCTCAQPVCPEGVHAHCSSCASHVRMCACARVHRSAARVTAVQRVFTAVHASFPYRLGEAGTEGFKQKIFDTALMLAWYVRQVRHQGPTHARTHLYIPACPGNCPPDCPPDCPPACPPACSRPGIHDTTAELTRALKTRVTWCLRHQQRQRSKARTCAT